MHAPITGDRAGLGNLDRGGHAKDADCGVRVYVHRRTELADLAGDVELGAAGLRIEENCPVRVRRGEGNAFGQTVGLAVVDQELRRSGGDRLGLDLGHNGLQSRLGEEKPARTGYRENWIFGGLSITQTGDAGSLTELFSAHRIEIPRFEVIL
ncbi:MAG: hypothetical protein KL863_28940 [Rhizobium sp.]|nr:hypothetical protein [Rhizobium sp.]MBX9459729.1 hypothetical protein [Rhizobium sp.]